MPLLSGFKYNQPANKMDYPFNLDFLDYLSEIEFKSNVTLLVGENGSGKSTLLEGLGAKLNLPNLGEESIATDPSLAKAREFSQYLKLIWHDRIIKNGFFFRAEDYFNYLKRINRLNFELEQERKAVKLQLQEQGASDYAISLATGSLHSQRQALISAHGSDADARSHGEGFLHLFKSRLRSSCIYLLDEPEAALSPMRQLALIKILLDAQEDDNQFIIATHSPILMAFPYAQILELHDQGIEEKEFQDLEHVKFTKMFLENPQAFLRHLKN
ncbi:MAG: AAA family ATPase [Firmicutes bacterium]|nr:AAA family ATPase [Bacillota bacterium]